MLSSVACRIAASSILRTSAESRKFAQPQCILLRRSASRYVPWSKRTPRQRRTAYLMLTVPVLTLGLGNWQMYRLQWKLGLIKQLESRMHATPVDLSTIAVEEWGRIPEYTLVKLVGSFDYSREVRIEMRQLIDESESEIRKSQGNTTDARTQAKNMQKRRAMVGEQQVVAMVLETGESVLVNRGWLPRDWPSDRVTRPVGRVELVAVVRGTERSSRFAQQNELDESGLLRTRWFTRDVDQLSSRLGCQPMFVDAVRGDPELEKRTLLVGKALITGRGNSGDHDLLVPIGGQTRVQLRNEHLNYALTWYLVSILTSMLWFMRYVLP